MIDATRKQMSAILKEMALTCLANPKVDPTLEAAAAALLLSHVAWQRANGDEFQNSAYAGTLAEMQRARPEMWKEMKSPDPKKLVSMLEMFKKSHYPNDRRKVVSCGIFDNKFRVEWTE